MNTNVKNVSHNKFQKPKSVAEYIGWQINLCGKSQLEISEEAGFNKPNIITMIKQGKTKLPLDKIGRFAKAIEVDPINLFKMCMAEYSPETWESIESITKQPMLTANEVEIIEIIRQSNVQDPKIRTDEERQKLLDFVDTLKSN